MNKTLLKIKESRPDLSDYLFHFTKGANALDTLWQIFNDQKIKDVKKTGVICFTETPLYNLTDMFKIFNPYKNPLFAPYGIAIPKQKLFNLGARPVIYGPTSEIKLLDSSIHWRYESIEENKDFSWLREWRINTNEVDLTPDDCFIVTKTVDEDLSITHSSDVIIDGDFSDGQWWDLSHIDWLRGYKSISIEYLVEHSINNSNLLSKEIKSQIIK